MKTWKQNMEATKARYCNWWNHEGTIVNMWEHFQEGVTPHAEVAAPPHPKDLQQKWFDPEWRADYLDWYVAHSSLKADMLPVANTQLGPGSLAAILGGVFEGGEDTIWIHPDPHFSPDIEFDPQHPNYVLHKRLLKACKQKAQGHYYVGMPDLMEGLDVLAALKGTDQVLMDTVMQPELVERQMERINDIYFQVFDELYDIIREGDEMAFCYFSAWAPGKMTKLQSDISTMISEDDYRRFVQPFIRQQCRQIPYTLYHLDGVGAIRHLPALLEIKELNAIQWTPGAGQPQGGSSKWYDLYRRILDGGKSLMCCWVTLEELPQLLDHIGTEGVHLEMDFHNEQEVEQALSIVEKAKTAFVPYSLKAKPTLEALSQEKILVLDGGMGTMIQQTLPDFKGCSDLLCVDNPQVISHIHRQYLEAGADLIETCTFNAQRISMADYGATDRIREINLAACQTARAVADEFSSKTPEKPRYVLGSIGPTSKTITPTSDAAVPLDANELRSAYAEQISALIDGGVDGLLIETIFDVENARICIEAAEQVMQEKHQRVPLLLSFSVNTPDGHNMMGQSIIDFISSINSPLFSVGVNCHGHVAEIQPFIERLASQMPYRISFYPNAGQPDSNGRYAKTPEGLQADLWPLLEGHTLNIVGGCCGTTNRHIKKIAEATEPLKGLRLSPHEPGKTVNTEPQTLKRQEKAIESGQKGSLFDAILYGLEADAEALAQQALDAGADPEQLVNNDMIGAMTQLGNDFEAGRAFVPQLLMAGRAMKAALQVLGNAQQTARPKALGRVVIGTVKGDLHDIGKNLVASMLEGCGFEVVNIGIDVPTAKFIEEVKRQQPDILCMSALLTTTMGYMKEVIDALEAEGLRQKVKVMVGGAPITQRFANEIGADGYSDNANSAVAVAKQLLKLK